MRTINWIEWHRTPILHVHARGSTKYISALKILEGMDYAAYDPDGRLMKADDPFSTLPVILTAKLNLNYPYAGSIAFDMERYAWIIGKRISSTEVHKLAFAGAPWLSIADRDYLFEHILSS